jgi:hypothetical protein
MVVQQVEGRFGRVAAQKLMRVRNTRGETAIHLALVCGTPLPQSAALEPMLWSGH